MQLPGPFRAAVGLAVELSDEFRHLPDRAIELPMLAVSIALQGSLRAQQRYAQLAARGDEVLNHREPTEEPPPWARFDDPLPLDPSPVQPHDRAVFDDRPREATVLAETLEQLDAVAAEEEAGLSPIPDEQPADSPGAAPAGKTGATRTPAKKTTKKTTTATRKTAGASADGKRVPPPRHTAPSRFDSAGD